MKFVKIEILISILLVFLISASMGFFFFDHDLILYENINQGKITVFSSGHHLISLVKYSLASLMGIVLGVLVLSFVLKRKKDWPFSKCFLRQVLTFAPLLFLVLSHFCYARAVLYIIFIPLLPALIALVLSTIFYLNLNLHLDLYPFRKGWFYLKNNPLKRKKYSLVILVGFLLTILIHQAVSQPLYKRYTGHKLFVGDEPKYLRMAYSLASDWDLDLTGNYIGDAEEIEREKKETLQAGQRNFGSFSVIGKDGGIYHIHMPGLSFFILPAFLLDLSMFEQVEQDSALVLHFLPRKLPFTRLWLMMTGILTFLLAARLIHRFFKSFLLLAILLLLYIFQSTIPGYMLQMYPEVTAVLLCLLALNALLFPFKKNWLNYGAVILSIGFLPWLHQRFIPLAFGLYVAVILAEAVFKKNFKKVALITLFLLILSLPYFYYFYDITGDPMPTSMYKLWGTTYTKAAVLPAGFIGRFMDSSSGLISLFPWTIMALIGIYWSIRQDSRKAALLMAIFLPYYLIICIQPWYGIVQETTRLLAVSFPFLLLFFAYTLKALYRRLSSIHLVLYVVLLAAVYLNKKFSFVKISLGSAEISMAQVIQIGGSLLFLVGLFFFLHWSDRFSERHSTAVRLDKMIMGLKRAVSFDKISLLLKRTVRLVVFLLISAPVVFLLVISLGWESKAPFMSLFQSFSKFNATQDFRLSRIGNPAEGISKNDKKFEDLIKNVYEFRMAVGQREEFVRLGNTRFYEKLPRGCYRVDVEMEGLSAEEKFFELGFGGELRELKLRESSNVFLASTIFLLFKDEYTSPRIRIILENSPSNDISGKLKIFPVPSIVYGKDLVLWAFHDKEPLLTQRDSRGQHHLVFHMYRRGTRKRYKFLLSMVGASQKPGFRQKVVLASRVEIFTGLELRRVDMGFTLPQEFNFRKSRLLLSVYDDRGRLMSCRSMRLKIRDRQWMLEM